MSLFADTSGLYALLVRSEREHEAVAAAFRRAAQGGRRLVTSNYVLLETAALLQHRIGLNPVRDLQTRIVPVLDVHWVSAVTHERAVERLFRLDRRRVSLVDAVSFTVMELEGLTRALSLDEDFAAAGFEVVP